ncbi:polysaccharide biosynthesis protein PslF [Candidatus Magnetomoraceae bacterium gMMP-1]
MYIAIVSSSLPRKCGIATFSGNLSDTLTDLHENFNYEFIAISDKKYEYPSKVKYIINGEDKHSFLQAAMYINQNEKIDLVNIQHEFQLYGRDGKYTESFLSKIVKPIVTTMHAVPGEPDESKLKAIEAIGKYSQKITVMGKTAKQLLTDKYGVDENKIKIIPHPVLKMEKIPKKIAKEKSGLIGQMVMSTFGLIRRDKALEYAIQAVPAIIEKFPDFVYLIIGITHPQHKKREGESYRRKLEALANSLNITKNIRFINKFIPYSELAQYLSASDIYITPYLGGQQVSSGSLIYGMYMGPICLSTPFVYAKEVLSNDRGILIDFRDSEDISQAVIKLLSDKKLRQKIKKKAFEYTQRLSWPNLSDLYIKAFNETIDK